MDTISKRSEEVQNPHTTKTALCGPPALGEAVLRRALRLNLDLPDYSPALPYRALAALYAHVNDYRSVLEALKRAQQAAPSNSDAANVEHQIQSVEQYLATQGHVTTNR